MSKPRTNWKGKFQDAENKIDNLKDKLELLSESQAQKEEFYARINNIGNKHRKDGVREWISIVIAFLVLILIYQQTKIFKNQTTILVNQESLITEQNELFGQQNSKFDLQNELFNKQNEKIDLQNNLFELQNSLVSIQNDKAGYQNKLINSQNELFANQNIRIDQQTELQEAERRGSLVFLFNNVLDKIDEELKVEENYNRVLSTELIARIASLTQALKPYKYLRNNEMIDKAVSPERGQLLSALMNFDLDSLTYIKIFKKANFQNSELYNTVLSGVTLNGINLANSDIINSNISSTSFLNSSLDNVVLDGSIMKKSFFYNCSLRYSKFRYVNAENSKFTRCHLFNSDFSNSFFRNSQFKSKLKSLVEWGEVVHGDFVSKKIDNLRPIKKIEDFNLILFTSATYTHSNKEHTGKYYHEAYISEKLEAIKGENPKEFRVNNPTPSHVGDMNNVNFSNTNLMNAEISNYDLINTNFEGSTIINIKFFNNIVNETYFDNAEIDKETFIRYFEKSQIPIKLNQFYELIEEKRNTITQQKHYGKEKTTTLIELGRGRNHSYKLQLKKKYSEK